MQALELVWGEMRRPDLTPGMRCILLNAAGSLCAVPEVAAFWRECAALGDAEVGKDVLGCVDVDSLWTGSPKLVAWWTGLAVGMLRR